MKRLQSALERGQCVQANEALVRRGLNQLESLRATRVKKMQRAVGTIELLKDGVVKKTALLLKSSYNAICARNWDDDIKPKKKAKLRKLPRTKVTFLMRPPMAYLI